MVSCPKLSRQTAELSAGSSGGRLQWARAALPVCAVRPVAGEGAASGGSAEGRLRRARVVAD
jgi:hypothetical protein